MCAESEETHYNRIQTADRMKRRHRARPSSTQAWMKHARASAAPLYLPSPPNPPTASLDSLGRCLISKAAPAPLKLLSKPSPPPTPFRCGAPFLGGALCRQWSLQWRRRRRCLAPSIRWWGVSEWNLSSSTNATHAGPRLSEWNGSARTGGHHWGCSTRTVRSTGVGVAYIYSGVYIYYMLTLRWVRAKQHVWLRPSR